ncbi:S1C family serine protease [Chloroflexota bacterium]
MKRVNIKYLVLSIILITPLILGSGCALLPDVEIPPLPTPTPTPTATPVSTNIIPDYTLPPSENSAPVLPGIADVVAEVTPSVVAITTEYTVYDIFRREYTEEGAGSGWIVDESGLIVTNNHVVEGAESVTVTMADGQTFAAETIRTDALTDLAVVKIDATGLPAAKIGDSSKLRVGDWVVAIGNPLGEGISATEGIVSRLGVSISVSSGQTLYDLIRTSAAINPGNSGGPLVNMAGEVIGITSAKLAAVEVEGIGYAISSSTASPVIEELVQKGYVVRPWLGIVLQDVTPLTKSRYNLAVDEGAFIYQMAQDSPAQKAGLAVGDVIVSFDDKEITNVQELLRALHDGKIGQEVEITFWRGDTKSTATAMLTETLAP